MATDVNRFQPNQWMLMGGARSKCEHLSGAPLTPDVAQNLYQVTLVKGALATTAIEGNTLDEEQARGILDGTFKAPPSRQYQEQGVRNVLDTLGDLHHRIIGGENVQLTTALVREFNRQVLRGLEAADGVNPGEIRPQSVTVADYRGAPAEDCAFLLDRLVDWLNSSVFQSEDPELRFALCIARAVYAHLYLAWIHPFADGNGRTARMVEFMLLARSGLVPIPAAHLLSNHYNLTRDRYYRELARASKSGGDTLGFVSYALEGFVDGIREAIVMVRNQQIYVTWVNYIHSRFAEEPNTKAMDRQRALVLAMPQGTVFSRADLEGITSKVARMYASAGPRTLMRDLNHLSALGLIRKVGRMFTANWDVVLAFLPPIAEIDA